MSQEPSDPSLGRAVTTQAANATEIELPVRVPRCPKMLPIRPYVPVRPATSRTWKSRDYDTECREPNDSGTMTAAHS